MVKHIVAWKLAENLSEEEKLSGKIEAKEALEALMGKIDGLLSIEVDINPLKTSEYDMVLISCLESEKALLGYQVHPEHIKAAALVKKIAKARVCLDFEN